MPLNDITDMPIIEIKIRVNDVCGTSNESDKFKRH